MIKNFFGSLAHQPRIAILALAGFALASGLETGSAQERFTVKHGKIKQSVMGWCFNPMPAPELAKHCKEIGLVAIEGIGAEHYPAVRELGLEISLVSSHGFKKGPVDPANHEFCGQKLREAIDTAVKFDSKRVITFTGMTVPGMSKEQGAENCVKLWKSIMPYAEENGILVCLEHLNSRDDSHPMKGHPGYFGDDVDFCVDMIKRVGSPNMKLLFDIYHVQVMNGDVIRRIRQYKDVIGHYHTAGCPGRAELDDTQEINYPPIMRAILETGYQGYVAQEFIPTWNDPIAALRHAAEVCDVAPPMPKAEISKLKENEGVWSLDGAPFTGAAIKHSEDGKILLRRWEMKNGLLHGLVEEWWDNGKKMTETHFDNGKRHGENRYWYMSGDPQKLQIYEHGKSISEEIY
ncbi:MAG: hydroxypyruvate isomerase [Verrucomicrobiales bacterium]|jgi:hydroxypyruvate isomerase